MIYFSKSADLTSVSYVSTGLTWVVIKDQANNDRKRTQKALMEEAFLNNRIIFRSKIIVKVFKPLLSSSL